MTFGNEYSNSKVNPSVNPYSTHFNPFPYSHYYHLVRSKSSTADLPSDSENTEKKFVNGYLNANIGSGQGIKLNSGGEVGGNHGIGLNAGGNFNLGDAGMYAGGHIGSPSYGIHAQGNTHLDSSQGLGLNAEAQAFGKYGLAAETKNQLGGGQGAELKTHLQLGGENGLGAQAKAQLGGGQGVGFGVGGQVGNYNGQVGFNIGGKDKESKE